MILVDFSAVMFQGIFGAYSALKPPVNKDTGLRDMTPEVSRYIISTILLNLSDAIKAHPKYAREVVLCLDDHAHPNWRHKILPTYKRSRSRKRADSKIDFKSCFALVNELLISIENATPWKVVSYDAAEGDDIILCLAHQYAPTEPILIISSDKDMLQASEYGPDVKQYSLLNKSYITFRNKGTGSLSEWVVEHVALGDAADEIPKVVDDTRFTPEFRTWLDERGYEHIDEYEFNTAGFIDAKSDDDVAYCCRKYDLYTELARVYMIETRHDTIFMKERFGIISLQKVLRKYGCYANWIKTNPMYDYNSMRNFNLIMHAGIPEEIKAGAIQCYNEAKHSLGNDFRDFLTSHQCENILIQLPSNMLPKRTLTPDFFDF